MNVQRYNLEICECCLGPHIEAEAAGDGEWVRASEAEAQAATLELVRALADRPAILVAELRAALGLAPAQPRRCGCVTPYDWCHVCSPNGPAPAQAEKCTNSPLRGHSLEHSDGGYCAWCGVRAETRATPDDSDLLHALHQYKRAEAAEARCASLEEDKRALVEQAKHYQARCAELERENIRQTWPVTTPGQAAVLKAMAEINPERLREMHDGISNLGKACDAELDRRKTEGK